MKIEKVAVLGAGAVGSYVIWGLSQKKEIRLGVIAEGERAERLKKGCRINGVTYNPEVWTPQEAQGVDLLVVCLKYGALPEAMGSIRTAVGENTTVMSLMNGVDSEELIAAEIGAAPVLPSLIKVASHQEEDGYHFDPETTIGIIFGEGEAPYQSERVQAIEELLKDTGIHYRSTEQIQAEIWSKFRLNVCNNLPQAILGAGVGCYRDSIHMKEISNGLRRELEAVAKAKGIDLKAADDSSSRGSEVPPTARYSTLQDLDAGRHTEIDMFSGALMRMGKELGIAVPYTLINVLLNSIPVFIGLKFIAKKFTISSVCVIVLSGLLTDIIPSQPITYDTLLISIFGGMINGLVISICLMMNATTGGTDFIAIYLSDKKGVDSFNIVLGLNAVILVAAGILFGWDKALYSIIFQYASTQVLHVLYKKYQQKTLFVVTNHPQEISNAIAEVSNHGATILEGEGSYEHCERYVVYSVVSSAESEKVIKAVRETDPQAFINAIRTEQVSGRFYQKPAE